MMATLVEPPFFGERSDATSLIFLNIEHLVQIGDPKHFCDVLIERTEFQSDFVFLAFGR